MKKLILLTLILFSTLLTANDKEKTEEELITEFMQLLEREKNAEKKIIESKEKTERLKKKSEEVRKLSKTVNKLSKTLGVE